MIFISKNFKETQKIGEKFGKTLACSAIICLEGDLGSGKTTFIKGLAKGLGIKNAVTSPTFLMIKKYEIKRGGCAARSFYHIDCYRADNVQKLQFLGIEDILKEKSAITAIEWPEKIKDYIPERAITIKFEWVSENERKICIKK